MASRTGQAVALMRADMIRPHTPTGDPAVQRGLCAGMAPTNVTRPGIAARTRFFDDQVLAALGDGVRQVIICGAGYDDRAWRFRTPGVRFFELDHPATQADKQRRLSAIGADVSGVEFVAADFRDADTAAVLRQHGHEAALPTMMLAEGLLVYLDRAIGERLLSELRSVAAPGSTLVASLALHAAGLDSDYVAGVANSRRPNAAAEPWQTIMPVDEYVTTLERCGWHMRTAVDAAELEPGAPSGRTLLIAASQSLGLAATIHWGGSVRGRRARSCTRPASLEWTEWRTG